jgi:hypothetical protein
MGRTTMTPTAEVTANTTSCSGTGSPIIAETDAINAATPSSPRAAVSVKISATANTTAMISQMTQTSMAAGPPARVNGPLGPVYAWRRALLVRRAPSVPVGPVADG